jgi:hypothetical protein
MSRRTIFCSHDPLGDRLRREARQSRPAFSQALHERIAAVVEQQRLRRMAQRHDSPSFRQTPTVGQRQGRIEGNGRGEATIRPRLSRVATLVAAACVALMVVGVGWQWTGRSLPVDGQRVDDGSQVALARANTVSTQVGQSGTPSGATVRNAASGHGAGEGQGWAAAHSPPRAQPVGPGVNLDRLVCDDARRGARVLLDRLPIDLALSDLTQIDK